METTGLEHSLLPILEETLGLAEDALMAQKAAQQKIATKEQDIATLRQQLADQERVILEKVARQQRINPVDLERLFDQFENLNILTPQERVKLAGHVQRDPALIIPIFQKAATLLSRAPGEGAGVSQDDMKAWQHADAAETDPDGWGLIGTGREVPLRQY